MTTLDELRLQVEELRASRARVVAAADAERRLLERALHDGVQQHLVALAVNLQLVCQLVDSAPAEATTLLEELAHDVREALESVRQIAQRIYPPLLIDRGLAEALAGAASAAGVATRVDVAGLGRYLDDIEAAVYFCCLQALGNVAENARTGTLVTVRVWEEHDVLHFEVTEACPQAQAPTRQASAPMSDRLGALGGQLMISSDPHQGTCVHGTIPLTR